MEKNNHSWKKYTTTKYANRRKTKLPVGSVRNFNWNHILEKRLAIKK